MKRPPKKWINACTAAVEEHGGAVSPGAVCAVVWNRKSDAEKRRVVKKEEAMKHGKKSKKTHHKKGHHRCVRVNEKGQFSKNGKHRKCFRVKKAKKRGKR